MRSADKAQAYTLLYERIQMVQSNRDIVRVTLVAIRTILILNLTK